jgi:hypothetical protein
VGLGSGEEGLVVGRKIEECMIWEGLLLRHWDGVREQ